MDISEFNPALDIIAIKKHETLNYRSVYEYLETDRLALLDSNQTSLLQAQLHL